ncbi:hypothetical protein [Subtercola sp. YIM 133946]|uniref:hypothetical protein n=1 Tax=Subtercola sp. YIM 133946 TaxID=3118909 RepID=UPI002F924424
MDVVVVADRGVLVVGERHREAPERLGCVQRFGMNVSPGEEKQFRSREMVESFFCGGEEVPERRAAYMERFEPTVMVMNESDQDGRLELQAPDDQPFRRRQPDHLILGSRVAVLPCGTVRLERFLKRR